MTEPPDPWMRPGQASGQSSGQSSGAQPPEPGTPAGTPPGIPTPYDWGSSAGNFEPSPAWMPPPREGVKAGQVFGGIAAWFAINGTILFLARGTGIGSGGTLWLLLNVAIIIGSAVKGHKGFAIGYAVGFVVAFVLALGACFVLLSSVGG